MSSGWKSLVVRISTTLLAFGVIIYWVRDKWDETLQILRHDVLWEWFALGVLVYGLGLLVISKRLQVVFKVQKIHISFWETVYVGMIGLFFNLFLPSAVGGDLAKGYYAAKISGKKMAAGTSVLLDRLMGFATLVVMAVVGLLLRHQQMQDPRIERFVFLFLGALIATALILLSKRIAGLFKFLRHLVPSEKGRDAVRRIYDSIHQYRNHKKSMFFCLLLSLLSQTFFVVSNYYASVSLGGGVEFSKFFIFIPLIGILGMVPSIGGLGVREAGVVYFFGKMIGTERAFAFSLLLVTMIYGYSLISGIVYGIREGFKPKVIHDLEKMA